jgi:hypothetical protein
MSMINMTPEEEYRLNGVVTGDRLINLLDAATVVESADGACSQCQEALGCFPDEGFMGAEIDELDAFAKTLRGDKRDRFLETVNSMKSKLQDQEQAAEYGADELRKAIKTMKGPDS